MITARTRIYRQRPGRWVAVTITPDGHRTRRTFATGQAALIALDERNRPRTQLELVGAAIAETYSTYVRAYNEIYRGIRGVVHARPEDFVLAQPLDGDAP